MKIAKKYILSLIKNVKNIISQSGRTHLFAHIGADPEDDYVSTSPSTGTHKSYSMTEFLTILNFDMNSNKRFRIGNCTAV